MKKTKLRADPAKTRAWADRSAAAAAAKAATRPRVPLKRSKGLSAAAAPARGEDPGALPVRFRGPALAGRLCVRCGARAQSWHHWLPQQHLRVYVRGLAQAEGLSLAASRTVLGRLLRDRRNISPVCAVCHDRHELHVVTFTREHAPASAFAFADELGPEWGERLRRMYPAAAGGSENGSTRRSSA